MASIGYSGLIQATGWQGKKSKLKTECKHLHSKKHLLKRRMSLLTLSLSTMCCLVWHNNQQDSLHYNDVIMGAIASQITSLTIVYSIVYSDADQRKHQSSASLAFARGIHRDRWIPRTNGQLRGKWFHLMTSSWWGVNIEECLIL